MNPFGLKNMCKPKSSNLCPTLICVTVILGHRVHQTEILGILG